MLVKTTTDANKYSMKRNKMDNIMPKYKYIQCFVSYSPNCPSQNTWDDVKKLVNEQGYEIYQMTSVHDFVVYLLRKELAPVVEIS